MTSYLGIDLANAKLEVGGVEAVLGGRGRRGEGGVRDHRTGAGLGVGQRGDGERGEEMAGQLHEAGPVSSMVTPLGSCTKHWRPKPLGISDQR